MKKLKAVLFSCSGHLRNAGRITEQELDTSLYHYKLLGDGFNRRVATRPRRVEGPGRFWHWTGEQMTTLASQAAAHVVVSAAISSTCGQELLLLWVG
ncbi:hypothetical protein ElyMa_000738200 [Elysia marginata]|uniref:Uncharacterized protein n=1 Tax=Elysia marginata TaxID=1093978 RepID=A0AAV4GP29_9GAST|nr:hypothetical protein ElyMa_000738200 [Elysia marginata]